MSRNAPLLLPLDSTDATLAVAGGKGANLSRLVRAGFPVPPGVIISTAAYRRFVTENALQQEVRQLLTQHDPGDPATVEALSRAIRARFEAAPIPDDLRAAITRAYQELGAPPVAVRSSATAEDLPDYSFAGQQDTFLQVVGPDALLDAVRRCWSSLWSGRAIAYRARNHVPQDGVELAVVVQQMVSSEASGVLFTADPLGGRRDLSVIDATFGLGEPLVAGQVEPDHFVVESASGRIVERRLGEKAVALRGKAEGGTTSAVPSGGSTRQAVPDEAIRELVRLGAQVARQFESPQDIEWAWAGGELFLLQARPITSLYPLPDDLAPFPPQLLLSFGAFQGVLEPLTPLGRGVITLIMSGGGRLFGLRPTPRTQRVFHVAGERLWVNATPFLGNRAGTQLLSRFLAATETGAAAALERVQEAHRFATRRPLPPLPALLRILHGMLPILLRIARAIRTPDAARTRALAALHRYQQLAEETLARPTTLAGRLAALEAVTAVTFPLLIPRVMGPALAGMLPLALLHRLARGVPKGAEHVMELTRGLPHNVTTEMDLELWACAQQIRTQPEATAQLLAHPAEALASRYQAGGLVEGLQGPVAYFLERYGHRGVAEIDLGRPRWREEPMLLFQTLRSYAAIVSPTRAPDLVFERGATAAWEAQARLAASQGTGLRGWLRSRLVRAAARRVRALAGLRESPKFVVVQMLDVARRALLASGQELADAGTLARADDIFFLQLDELWEVAAGAEHPWCARVAERRARYQREQRRQQIPRAMLSDGTVFHEGSHAAEDNKGSLVGTPVSPGAAEGPVRIVFDPGSAAVEPGAILVCPGTDPAWTPLFLAAGGLVTEVGGLMTHGSVVAREYGIPAVVGVRAATRRLREGERVRVDGSRGTIVLRAGVGEEYAAGLSLSGLQTQGGRTVQCAPTSRRRRKRSS